MFPTYSKVSSNTRSATVTILFTLHHGAAGASQRDGGKTTAATNTDGKSVSRNTKPRLPRCTLRMRMMVMTMTDWLLLLILHSTGRGLYSSSPAARTPRPGGYSPLPRPHMPRHRRFVDVGAAFAKQTGVNVGDYADFVCVEVVLTAIKCPLPPLARSVKFGSEPHGSTRDDQSAARRFRRGERFPHLCQ